MHFGNIIRKNADQTIPDDVLAKLLEEYPSCIGVAMPVKDEADNTSLECDTIQGPFKLEDVKSMLKDMEAATVYLYAGDFPQGYLEDDIQPFVLFKDDENNPLLVLFCEGNFENYAEADSNHSNEFHAMNKFIQPFMSKLLEESGAETDIGTFLGKLDEPMNKQILINSAIGRGTFLFVARDGTAKMISRNIEEREFPWGFMSSHMNFPVVLGKDETKPEPKKLSLFNKLKKSVTEAAATEKVAAVSPVPADEMIAVSPGPSEKSYGDLRSWYHKVAGNLPQNYKARPTVMVSRKKAQRLGILKDFKDLPVAMADKGKLPDQAATNVVTGAKVAAESSAPGSSLIIEPAIKKEIKETLDKMTALDADALQKLEANYPDFEEQTGIRIEDVYAKRMFILKAVHTKEWAKVVVSLIFSLLKDRKKMALEINELTESLDAMTAPMVKGEQPKTEEAKPVAAKGNLLDKFKKKTA